MSIYDMVPPCECVMTPKEEREMDLEYFADEIYDQWDGEEQPTFLEAEEFLTAADMIDYERNGTGGGVA